MEPSVLGSKIHQKSMNVEQIDMQLHNIKENAAESFYFWLTKTSLQCKRDNNNPNPIHITFPGPRQVSLQRKDM